MFTDQLQETESKEYLCHESLELLRAMLRHMYGDGTMALTFYCNVLPAAIHDDLKASVSASRFQYALDRLEEHRLIYDLDPGYQRAVARLHAHICKHLT